jgi:hypothetical protein
MPAEAGKRQRSRELLPGSARAQHIYRAYIHHWLKFTPTERRDLSLSGGALRNLPEILRAPLVRDAAVN